MILDRTIQPRIRKMEDFEIQSPDHRVLKNGMDMYVITAGTEDVIRFDLVIEGGQWDQQKPLQALFTNRMLREGSQNFTSCEIAEKLDYYGAWLDLSSSVKHGFITLYSLSKCFEQTLAILADMIKHPTFPEKELRIVTNTNKQQFIVNSEKVDTLARKQLNVSLFGENHPLGHFATCDDFEKICTSDLKQFHQKYYSSSNSTIYVSGRVTEKILKEIELQLGDESWGQTNVTNDTTLYTPQPIQEKSIFIEKADALQSSLKMGMLFVDRNHQDYLKSRVLVTLLGGYFGSRLMSNIREDKGYTYGIGAGIVSFPNLSALVISSEADNTNIRPMITEVYKEIDRLRNERVSQEELEMVKNYMLGDFSRAYEGALSIADAWIYVQTAGVDFDFFNRSLRAINEVTSEELLDLAQKYLRKEEIREVVAGKRVD